MSDKPQPSYAQSAVTGLGRGLLTALTWPVGMAGIAARFIDPLLGIQPTSDKSDPFNILGSLNEYLRGDTAEPTDIAHQAIEAAPSIALNPGIIGKAIGAIPLAIEHQEDIRRAVDPRALEGINSAVAGVESQPLGAPQRTITDLIREKPQGEAPLANSSQQAQPWTPDDVSAPPVAQQWLPGDISQAQPWTPEDIDPRPPDQIRTDQAVGSTDQSQYSWAQTALIAGAGLAAVAGAAMGVKMLRNSNAQSEGKVLAPLAKALEPVRPDADVASAIIPGVSPATGAVTQTIDKMAPAREAVNQLPPGTQRDVLQAQITTSNQHAMDAMVDDVFKTGRLPGSTIKLDKPPAQVFEAISQLSDEEQTALSDITRLNTRIDQSANNNYQPWGAGPNQLTYQDMVNKRNSLLQRYPQVTPLVDDYHDMFRKIPQYLEQHGVIDAATRSTLESVNQNYAPQRASYDSVFAHAIFGSPRMGGNKADTSFLELFKREVPLESMPPGQAVQPLQAAASYFDNLTRAITINKARVQLGEALENNNIAGVKFTKTAPGDPEALSIPIYKDGEKQWLTTDNYGLWSALQFRPRTGIQALATINRAQASVLTGRLNPLFPFKAASYDAILAPSMMPEGTSIGPLSQGVATVGEALKTLGVTNRELQAPELLKRYDPTALVAPAWGTVRKLWGDAAYNVATSVEEGLRNNSLLARALGPQNMNALASMARDAFERSTVSLGERYGALGSNRFSILDDSKTVPEVLSNLPGFRSWSSSIANLPGINALNAAGDAIRESTRVQYLSSNIKRVPIVRSYVFRLGGVDVPVPVLAWEPKDEVNLLKSAAQTRRLIGDPAEIGGDITTPLGRGLQRLSSVTMYGNQSLQTTAQIARMGWEHPISFTGTQVMLNIAGIGAWQHALAQPDVKKQLDGMTPEQRSRVIPIAFNNKLYGFIGIPPEMRPVFGTALHVYMGLSGQLNPGDNETGDSIRMFTHSFMNDYLPNFASPMTTVGLVTGKTTQPNTLTLSDPRPASLEDAIDPDYKNSAQAWADNAIHTIGGLATEAVYGAIDQWWRARTQNMGLKDPSHRIDPSEAGAQALFEPFREPKQLGPLAGLWDLSTGVKASSANFASEKVWQETIRRLQPIIKEGSQTIKGQGSQLLTGLKAPQGMQGLIPDQSQDPQARTLYFAAKQLDAQLKPLVDEYHLLSARQQVINSNPVYSDPQKKTAILNNIAARKASMNEQMLSMIRAMEHQTGVSFSGAK